MHKRPRGGKDKEIQFIEAAEFLMDPPEKSSQLQAWKFIYLIIGLPGTVVVSWIIYDWTDNIIYSILAGCVIAIAEGIWVIFFDKRQDTDVVWEMKPSHRYGIVSVLFLLIIVFLVIVAIYSKIQ